jgi:hypothetical protein
MLSKYFIGAILIFWRLASQPCLASVLAMDLAAHRPLSLTSARPWLTFDSVAGMVPGGASGAMVLGRIFLLPPCFREPPAAIAVGTDIRESL